MNPSTRTSRWSSTAQKLSSSSSTIHHFLFFFFFLPGVTTAEMVRKIQPNQRITKTVAWKVSARGSPLAAQGELSWVSGQDPKDDFSKVGGDLEPGDAVGIHG